MRCNPQRIHPLRSSVFFFNAPAPTEIYTLSLHDALPIYRQGLRLPRRPGRDRIHGPPRRRASPSLGDRKSTRLNSSHITISYAVFCLKKKKNNQQQPPTQAPHSHSTHPPPH